MTANVVEIKDHWHPDPSVLYFFSVPKMKKYSNNDFTVFNFSGLTSVKTFLANRQYRFIDRMQIVQILEIK